MSERTLDPEMLSRWIGREETMDDVIEPRTARMMQALLDRAPNMKAGDALPPLWHWLYFPSVAPQSELGRDGHPKLGGFLPPVALPRRMWAGGRFGFQNVLRVGEVATRRSRISDVKLKQGRSGPLCFVTVRHEISAGGTFRFWEEHDIVYREDPKHGDAVPEPSQAPDDAGWQRRIEPGPVMLFRYSAITFNGHRIHYDRQYCGEVEGYPGLVFHGPLTATLLFDLLLERNPGCWVAGYSFRAVSPLFDTASFTLAGRREGNQARLWASTPGGFLAMSALADIA